MAIEWGCEFNDIVESVDLEKRLVVVVVVGGGGVRGNYSLIKYVFGYSMHIKNQENGNLGIREVDR